MKPSGSAFDAGLARGFVAEWVGSILPVPVVIGFPSPSGALRRVVEHAAVVAPAAASSLSAALRDSSVMFRSGHSKARSGNAKGGAWLLRRPVARSKFRCECPRRRIKRGPAR